MYSFVLNAIWSKVIIITVQFLSVSFGCTSVVFTSQGTKKKKPVSFR